MLWCSADSSLLHFSSSWPESEAPEYRAAVARDMQVFPEFVSEPEEASLMEELEPVLRRMRYEFDHWDDVSIKLHTYVDNHYGLMGEPLSDADKCRFDSCPCMNYRFLPICLF